MHTPVFFQELPGLTIEIYRYEDNPSETVEFSDLYFDGYWEVVITVSPEHLSVPVQIQKALLVIPKNGQVDEVVIDEEHTVFSLDVEDKPASVTWTYGQMPTPTRRPDADIIVIGISAEEEYKHIVLALQHKDDFSIPESILCN